MKPEVSIPYSQELFNNPYSKRINPIPRNANNFLKIYSNIVL